MNFSFNNQHFQTDHTEYECQRLVRRRFGKSIHQEDRNMFLLFRLDRFVNRIGWIVPLIERKRRNRSN